MADTDIGPHLLGDFTKATELDVATGNEIALLQLQDGRRRSAKIGDMLADLVPAGTAEDLAAGTGATPMLWAPDVLADNFASTAAAAATGAEIAAGTETEARQMSPAQVADAARTHGGTGRGTAFPTAAVVGTLFERTDLGARYRRNAASSGVLWDAVEQVAASAPTTSHDLDYGTTWGYVAGCRWVDTAGHRVYECRDPASGAADWHDTTGAVTWADLSSSLQATLDGLAAGINQHNSVRVAATADLALTGADTIDGVSDLADGDRVLATAQSAPSENGVYVYNSSGAWARATDVDAWAEFANAYVLVDEGTTNRGSGWRCEVDAGGTLDTDPITWRLFTPPAAISAGAGVSVSGGTVSIADTGVAPGEVTAPVVTFNARGQATAARPMVVVVASQTTTAPPSSPTIGDAYIVPASATGAWAGKTAGTLVRCTATTPAVVWTDTAPVNGWPVLVVDDDFYVYHDGTAWVELAASINPTQVTASQISAGSSTTPVSLAPADVAEFARVHGAVILDGAMQDAIDNTITLTGTSDTPARTFKLAADTNNPYFVWVNGTRVKITSDLSVQIPAPPTDADAMYYVYITAAGTMTVSTSSPWEDDTQGCPVAGVYWRSGNTYGVTVYMLWDFDRGQHIAEQYRNIHGPVWRSGFDVPSWGDTGAFTMSPGSWTAHGFVHASNADITKTTQYFRAGTTWSSSAERADYRPLNSTGATACYDNAGARTALTVDYFANVWLFASCRAPTGATGTANGGSIVIEAIFGQAQYATQTEAEAESIEDLTRPPWHEIDAARPLYRITFQRTASVPAGHVVSTQDLRRDWIVQGVLRGRLASPVSSNVTATNSVPLTRQVSAGSGLVGGGALSTDITLELDPQVVRAISSPALYSIPDIVPFKSTVLDLTSSLDFGTYALAADGDPILKTGTNDATKLQYICDNLPKRTLLYIPNNRCVVIGKTILTKNDYALFAGEGSASNCIFLNNNTNENANFTARLFMPFSYTHPGISTGDNSALDGGTRLTTHDRWRPCKRYNGSADILANDDRIKVEYADWNQVQVNDKIMLVDGGVELFKAKVKGVNGATASDYRWKPTTRQSLQVKEKKNDNGAYLLIFDQPIEQDFIADAITSTTAASDYGYRWRTASGTVINGCAFFIFREMPPQSELQTSFGITQTYHTRGLNFYNLKFMTNGTGGWPTVYGGWDCEVVYCEHEGPKGWIYGNCGQKLSYRHCKGRFGTIVGEIAAQSMDCEFIDCDSYWDGDRYYHNAETMAYLLKVLESSRNIRFNGFRIYADGWDPSPGDATYGMSISGRRCLLIDFQVSVGGSKPTMLQLIAGGFTNANGGLDGRGVDYNTILNSLFIGDTNDAEGGYPYVINGTGNRLENCDFLMPNSTPANRASIRGKLNTVTNIRMPDGGGVTIQSDADRCVVSLHDGELVNNAGPSATDIIISRTRRAPPTMVAVGDKFIMPEPTTTKPLTGAWASYAEDDLVECTAITPSVTYALVTPTTGVTQLVLEENHTPIKWSGSAWVSATTPISIILPGPARARLEAA